MFPAHRSALLSGNRLSVGEQARPNVGDRSRPIRLRHNGTFIRNKCVAIDRLLHLSTVCVHIVPALSLLQENSVHMD